MTTFTYRSKVVEIEAYHYVPSKDETGEHPSWLIAALNDGTVRPDDDDTLAIRTLEGTMIASPGDWIIQGTEGELYPCKPSVFERKYEKVT